MAGGEKNLAALADLSGRGSTACMAAGRRDGIMLDMDTPAKARPMASRRLELWNGHFGCTCYHPLFVFNQFGDLERCALRPGNVHSADGWQDVLDPVVARYRGKVSRIYFRADAAFAMPGVYEYLEDKRISMRSGSPPTGSCRSGSVICSSARSGVRRTMSAALTRASAIRLEAGPRHAG